MSRRVAVPALGVIAVALTAGLVANRVFAAFSSSTSNLGNGFQAGTVLIGDNDSGTALLAISSGKPNTSSGTDTGCIRVSTTGTLNSTVRLYASVAGLLPPYMTLTVTRGTDTSAFASCATFAADSTNYIGAGAGVIFNGKLSAFPTTYASGIVDPTSGSPATWTSTSVHTYKFVISLDNDPTAQGLDATADFTWEARNL